MSASKPDYSKVFNRLCHMIALTKDGKIEGCIDNLVLTLFIIDDSFAPTLVQDIVDAIEVYFGLSLNPSDIQTSLDRQQFLGKIIFNPSTRTYNIPIKIREEVAENISKASNLGNHVREEWLSSLEIIIGEVPKIVNDKLWECLRTYMGKAFKRHGVETIQLLHNIEFDGSTEIKTLSSYLAESILELNGYLSADIASKCIRSFFRNSTPERIKYISQLLDSTFTFFALANDEATTEYLSQEISPLSLFLDTNFIFGILDLHVNPLVEVSKQLLKLIKVHHLPFTLYYHEETLAEIKRTISSVGYRLKKQQWQQSISRAAVQSGQLIGLELRYHELNSITLTDPNIFFSKFEAVGELLEEYGFAIYNDPKSSDPEETFEKGKLIAEYKSFMERRRPNKPKPYEALNHDMAVWRTINNLRHKGASVLNVGSLFLTADFHLYAFDWQILRESGDLGIVVLPNQFLQLLRPFIPSNEDFDRRFVETFAIPEFRILGSDYAATCAKVLAYINTFKDISEKTAVRILANTLLIEQLTGVDETSPDFGQRIENALARDNEMLLEEKEALLTERSQTEKLLKNLEDKTKEYQDKMHLLEVREKEAGIVKANLEQKLISEHEKLSEGKDKLDAMNKMLQQSKERQRSILRITFGVCFGIFGTIGILLIPYIISWEWLSKHPNRLGLYGCSILIIIGISWAIADKDRRKYSLTAVVLGALLVLLQILGK